MIQRTIINYDNECISTHLTLHMFHWLDFPYQLVYYHNCPKANYGVVIKVNFHLSFHCFELHVSISDKFFDKDFRWSKVKICHSALILFKIWWLCNVFWNYWNQVSLFSWWPLKCICYLLYETDKGVTAD